MTTVHLSPPQGPVEPGGFDFRRHAWFQRLGAVGYTRVPVLTIRTRVGQTVAAFGSPRGGWRSRKRVQAIPPGEVGGFAAAVTTGDRSGMGQSTLESLRASNLAHLLAISGLHMGLLTGIRICFVPYRTFGDPSACIAHAGAQDGGLSAALVAAVIYLLLSGGNVATERAFVMVSVMLGAVLIDRRAISLRAVAVAALVVLILRPESLVSPGFQMSFAATTALVAVFGALREFWPMPGPKWLKPVFGIVLSSAIAGVGDRANRGRTFQYDVPLWITCKHPALSR